MKKIIIPILICISALTGCIYQGDLRPDLSDTEVWICEEPYCELYWSKEKGHVGKLCIGESEYNIVHSEDTGNLMRVYEHTEKPDFERDEMKYCLFCGDVNYGKEKISVTVEIDYKDIFKGEYPTLEFKKYNINEYFKEEQAIEK